MDGAAHTPGQGPGVKGDPIDPTGYAWGQSPTRYGMEYQQETRQYRHRNEAYELGGEENEGTDNKDEDKDEQPEKDKRRYEDRQEKGGQRQQRYEQKGRQEDQQERRGDRRTSTGKDRKTQVTVTEDTEFMNGRSPTTERRGASVSQERESQEEEAIEFIKNACTATTEELRIHMHNTVFEKEAIDYVVHNGMDGAAWMEVWASNDDYIKRCASEEMGIKFPTQMKYRGMVKKAKGGESGKTTRLTQDDAPEVTKPSDRTFNSREYKRYQEAAVTWMGNNDETWALKATTALKANETGAGSNVWKSMTKLQELIDKTLAIKMMKNTAIEDMISRSDPDATKRYRPGTKAVSGIRIMRMMQDVAMARNAAKMAAASVRS